MEPIITTAQQLQHLKGKYVKRLLLKLEQTGQQNQVLRKLILDNYNDFIRELTEVKEKDVA